MSYGKNWNPIDHYKNEEIAANYDNRRFSSFAGRLFNWREKHLIRRAFASHATGSPVADVPCGTGRLAEVLLALGFSVTGIDISSAMLAVAGARLKKFGDRFQTRVLDARKLSESSLAFDAALCARLLMHLPFPEQVVFLRAVTAVTRTRVVFTHGIDSRYQRFRRILKRVMRNQTPAVFPLGPGQMRELIRAAGLREIARYRVFPFLSEAVIIVTEPMSRRPKLEMQSATHASSSTE